MMIKAPPIHRERFVAEGHVFWTLPRSSLPPICPECNHRLTHQEIYDWCVLQAGWQTKTREEICAHCGAAIAIIWHEARK